MWKKLSWTWPEIIVCVVLIGAIVLLVSFATYEVVYGPPLKLADDPHERGMMAIALAIVVHGWCSCRGKA